MSLTLEVAGRSDVGRVRPSNEDNFGYDQRLGIFVVCDGMGGHAAGEIASQIAVDTLLAYFREHAPKVEDNAFLDDAPVGARLLAEAVPRSAHVCSPKPSRGPTMQFWIMPKSTRTRQVWGL